MNQVRVLMTGKTDRRPSLPFAPLERGWRGSWRRARDEHRRQQI